MFCSIGPVAVATKYNDKINSSNLIAGTGRLTEKMLSCGICTHLATLLHLAMLQWIRAQTLAPPKIGSCTHLATLLHLAMLQWWRAQTLAPPTPIPLWPLVHKKSRSLSGLQTLIIYQDLHWCLHQRTVYIYYLLQISRVYEAKLFCDDR